MGEHRAQSCLASNTQHLLKSIHLSQLGSQGLKICVFDPIPQPKTSSHLSALYKLLSANLQNTPQLRTLPKPVLLQVPRHPSKLSSCCDPVEQAQLEGQCLKQGSVRPH